MLIEFEWLNQDGVNGVLSMIYKIIDIIRIVVPIVLIIMTSLDIANKVIKPDEKEGQQKIMRRLIAAIIVFFVPMLINFIFNLAGIDNPNDMKNNGSGNGNQGKKDNSKNEIKDLLITNCPNSLNYFHNGDEMTLNTNIPKDYDGSITWSIKSGNKYVQSSPTNYKKSLNVAFYNIEYATKVDIEVVAGGSSNTCSIHVDKEKLDRLDFLNCPSSSNPYYVGDSFVLKANIPSTFKDEVKWSANYKDAVIIRPIDNQKSANIDFVDQPKSGNVTIQAIAGEKSKNCIINVDAIKDLKITNCPDYSNVFKNGDRIDLETNIPSFYKGDIKWSSNDSNNVSLIKSEDGKTATVVITGTPSSKSVDITVEADIRVKKATCKLIIESNEGPTPTTVPTIAPTSKPTPTSTPKPTATPVVCNPPTNVTINRDAIGIGKVRWDSSPNATDYEISINGNNWIPAYSGYDFKNVINQVTGLRTVYVRSVCGGVKSNSVSKDSINVYKIEVIKGSGIDFVNGGGNYLSGETATISAIPISGYSWDSWKSNTGNSISRQNYSFTVSKNETFTANAKLNPTPTPVVTPIFECDSENSPNSTNVVASYCNNIYQNYNELLLGAEENTKTGRYARYYGCLKNYSTGNYIRYECRKLN